MTVSRIPRASRLVLSLLAALAAGSSLTACFPLVVGGAMVGGTMVVTDRRTSGTQIEDETIELKSLKRVNDALGDRGHASITSYNRQVLITGEVPSEADKASVEKAVQSIENVRSTVNDLSVSGASSLTSRSSDAIITSKVKASFIDAQDILANAYKVVTERGTVYLMGRVTEREATRATDLARGVSGVLKVVRVFEIVPEAEMSQTLPKASK